MRELVSFTTVVTRCCIFSRSFGSAAAVFLLVQLPLVDLSDVQRARRRGLAFHLLLCGAMHTRRAQLLVLQYELSSSNNNY